VQIKVPKPNGPSGTPLTHVAASTFSNVGSSDVFSY